MDLKELREQIDAIDTLLASLIEKRREIVNKIGEFKKVNRLPVEDKTREEEILNKLTKEHKEVENEIKSIYSIIFELSKKKE